MEESTENEAVWYRDKSGKNFLTREGKDWENNATEIQEWSLPKFAIELLMRN